MPLSRRRLIAGGVALAATPLAALAAEPLAGAALVQALQDGGYVIAMRHASSPPAPPAAGEADAGNPQHERQLDQAGRDAATAMGAAIRRLRLPIGEVITSPTYRARETVRLAGLPAPATTPELGDGGQGVQSMVRGVAGASAGEWLRRRVAAPPRAGTDTIVVTHLPNLAAAFGEAAMGLGDGDGLVFRPDGRGSAEVVGRIRMADWPALAARG